MPSLRSLFLIALSLSTVAVVAESGDDDRDAFEALLNTVPSESLHAALHSLPSPKYGHGVFENDRTAIEAVRRHDPAVATSLVRMAKRQGTNQTATTSVEAEASVEPAPTPQTSLPPSPEASQGQPIPSSPGSTDIDSPQSTPPAESSDAAETPDASETSGTSEASETSDATSTSAFEAPSGSSSDRPSTTTGAPDSVEGDGSTATVVLTSTLANGERSTITAVTVVGGARSSGYEPPSGTAGAAESTPTTGRPGLQSNAAAPKYALGASELIAGGLMMGAMVF